MSEPARSGRVISPLRAWMVCTVALCAAVMSAGAGAAEKTAQPMKIGIIGTGNIGSGLATHWAKAGHELLISSRHPEELKELAQSLGPKVRVGTPKEAAAFGEVVVVSVPYHATPQVGRDFAAELKGKVVLDTGNPYPFRDGAMAEDARKRGTGVTSKEFLPGARLVRAFNGISARNLRNEAHRSGELIGIPLASDDADALAVAQRLVKDAGFDPVVVGLLSRAREFDVGTDVYSKGMTARELRQNLGLADK